MLTSMAISGSCGRINRITHRAHGFCGKRNIPPEPANTLVCQLQVGSPSLSCVQLSEKYHRSGVGSEPQSVAPPLSLSRRLSRSSGTRGRRLPCVSCATQRCYEGMKEPEARQQHPLPSGHHTSTAGDTNERSTLRSVCHRRCPSRASSEKIPRGVVR